MKRTVLVATCLLMAVMAMGQTQQGYVKTLGRPGRAGVPLGGVTVRVKGEHNAALSHDDGTFSFVLAGRKNGDAYVLQQVRKQGYELCEQGVIGRQQAFSDKVPLSLVMVNTAQLQADKQRIENTAFQVAERNYKQKLALLERQLAEKAVSAEKYREQLQQLQKNFENYQSLIDGLAEHYAHVDYDNLDEKEREINVCIENGDLERADSLLNTVFDPVDVLKRSKDALSRIEQQKAEGHQLLAQANEDMAAVLKQQEKDAEHLYQLYTIALSRFDNDKARFYIETRAELDTTNVEWQNDVLAMYRKPLVFLTTENVNTSVYLQRVMRKDKHTIWGMLATNNIGQLYVWRGDKEEALHYYKYALDISVDLFGEKDSVVAIFSKNVASVFFDMGNYKESLAYYSYALKIFQSIPDVNKQEIASLYKTIGDVYLRLDDYSNAYISYSHSLEIWTTNNNYLEMATIYDCYSRIAHFQGDHLEKEYDYSEKALSYRIKHYGEKHPIIAKNYSEMGSAFYLETLTRKLSESEKEMYNDKALVYYLKAQRIWDNLETPLDVSYADNCIFLGDIYFNKKDYRKAIHYYELSLSQKKRLYGENHPNLENIYNDLGRTYFILNDNQKATECFNKKAAIKKMRQEK